MSAFTEQLKNRRGAAPCLFYPMAGKLEVPLSKLLKDPSIQAEALAEISGIPSINAVLRMTELWCEAASFGMACEISEKDFPKLGDPIYTEIEELADMKIPQIENEVTDPLIDAVRLSMPYLEKPLIVGVTGPYTLCSVLNGSENFMMNCMLDPDAVHSALGRVTDYLIAYILAYKSVGASGVILAEPSASMVSPAMMDQFSNSYVQRVIESVQDEAFSLIYHNCGPVNNRLDVISRLNADAFHFGSQVDLGSALNRISKEKYVMGNLDPRLFITATPSDVENRTEKLRNDYSGCSNWIPSTGCDLSPNAKMINVEAFLKASAYVE
jgi:uroporphyrinogen decarboxylase